MTTASGGTRGLTTALAGFLVAKAAFIVAVAVTVGGSALPYLTRLDAGWYATIVEHGYTMGTEGRSNMAFFPLLPALAKLVSLVGVPPALAVLVVAWAGSLAAVVGIWLVGRQVADATVGTWAALLWAVAPRSHVEAMGYTEGMFTAAVAFSLLGVLQRRFWLAGLAGLAAGLLRPSAAPLIVTLGLVWVVDLVAAGRRGERLAPRQVFGPSFWAAVLSGIGMLGYLIYVSVRMGSPTGYFAVQRAWNQELGTPIQTVQFLISALGGTPQSRAAYLPVVAVLLLYLALFAWMVVGREPWQLIVFVALSMLLVFSQQNYYYAYLRFLLPLFPLWLPPARLLARARPWLSLSLLLGLIVGSALWGAQVAVSRFSP